MTASRRRWTLALVWLLAATLAISLFDALSPWTLRLNTSLSLPRGLYLATAYRGEALARDEIACFRYEPPAWAAPRQYFPVGYPLCKYVLAVPGERIEVAGATMSAHAPGQLARWLGDVARVDSQGRPVVPAVSSRFVLGRHQYWLGSLRHSKSFDSRYLGPVERSRIVFTLRPLLTETAP